MGVPVNTVCKHYYCSVPLSHAPHRAPRALTIMDSVWVSWGEKETAVARASVSEREEQAVTCMPHGCE